MCRLIQRTPRSPQVHPWNCANRHRACARLLGLVLLFAGVLTGGVRTAAAAEDARPRGRSYQDGPLTLDDYQAKPLDDSPLSAFTVTDIRWDYRYRYQSTDRTMTVYVTEMTIDAVVIASQSWNRHPKDKRVLDHEQGHFDLAMIAVLQMRLRFAEESQTRKLTVTGATMEIALENLKRKLEQELRAVRERLLAEHNEYDRVTRLGLDRTVQAEQRKSQLATLQKLTADLKKLEAKPAP